MLLSDGWRLSGCATDDAHFKGDAPDHFGGWVMVKAEANDPDLLLAALKAGEYYSSTGPELKNVEIDGDVVRVECSPVEHIIAIGQNSASASKDGRNFTRAELPLKKFRRHGWLRVVAMDGRGKRAWSNPIWLE